MFSIKQLISLVLVAFSFASTFYSVGKLAIFLSTPVEKTIQGVLLNSFLEDKSLIKLTLFQMLLNSVWVILFILQHSVMKTDVVKRILAKLGLDIAERSLFNMATAYCLLLLVNNWRRTETFSLWNVDITSRPILWWTFTVPHIFAWAIIYGGSLMMDLPELLGCKQVYYDVNDLAPPLSYKAIELREFYSRLRHPSFTGFLIILWCTNCMSLDRLLLAVILTVYMYLAWGTTSVDCQYQKYQLDRKKRELASR